MIHKQAVGPTTVKGADVTARFATLNVIDADNDVILPGAVPDGLEVPISAYGHTTTLAGRWPIGRGRISVRGDDVLVHASLFDTAEGIDAGKALAGLGELGEWSFGLTIDDADMGTKDGRRVQFIKSLSIHEVSPVLRGAGVNTATLDVSSDGGDDNVLATEIARRIRDDLHRETTDERGALTRELSRIRASLEGAT